jgi:hypothetical protein
MCSFIDYGFASPLIAQLVSEMREAMPSVFCDHLLTNVWGYTYAGNCVDFIHCITCSQASFLTSYTDGDSGDGITPHSDMAAVNVNCWTTPEEAVEEGSGGGMIIWPTRPDASTDLSKYNVMGSPAPKFQDGLVDMHFSFENESVSEALQFAYSTEEDNPKLVVPYKTNRCVIFDSSFVHATDKVKFGNGYKNRSVEGRFKKSSVSF